MGTMKKKTSFLAIAIVLAAHPLYSAVLVSNGCDVSSTACTPVGSGGYVQALSTSANDGDIITLPAGTFVWTTKVTITKGITLQGGTGTIVKDDVQSGAFLSVTLKPAKLTTIAGITFQDGGRTSIGLGGSGPIQVRGNGSSDGAQFHMYNCTLDKINGDMQVDSLSNSVIDHCTFNFNKGHDVWLIGQHWNDTSTQPWGDVSWTAPTNAGSSEPLFFEDDDFYNQSTTPNKPEWADGHFGYRVVVRHCTFHNAQIASHGTGNGGRPRGPRLLELYNNSWIGTNPGSQSLGGLQAGVFIVHDNRTTGYTAPFIVLDQWRPYCPYSPWGQADGQNALDVNYTSGPFFTGTAAANSDPNRNVPYRE